MWALDLAIIIILIAATFTLRTSCGPFGASFSLSYELWDAPCTGSSADRVAAWLQLHKSSILRTSNRYGIDSRAVAGVIAYEALRNVEWSNFLGFTRSTGPGKVHYKALYFSEGDPAAKQIEDLGILPRRTLEQRKAILSTPDGAITYIVAILYYGERDALKHGENIRNNPALLTAFYNEYTPRQLDTVLFMDSILHTAPKPDLMGKWVHQQLPYLSRALR